MTEAEWQDCADPDRMMAYLEGNASERKLCLLCCACCRRVWHLLETDALRQAVDAFDRFADGEIDEESFRTAASSTHPLRNYREEIFSGQPREGILWAAYAVNAAMTRLPDYGYRKALQFLAYAVQPHDGEEHAAHVDLIREVFENPFRPMNIPSLWRTPTVLRLAEAAYVEHKLTAGTLDTDRLGVLADALEEAGCSAPTILSHLRGPGPHVRGCWVVDLLLGKE
ncbi:MAG: hypothetical protein L0Z62_39885 [Gemmataceae bacterium]|nr:hypothetical protein [Gemmataceae bacterium]